MIMIIEKLKQLNKHILIGAAFFFIISIIFTTFFLVKTSGNSYKKENTNPSKNTSSILQEDNNTGNSQEITSINLQNKETTEYSQENTSSNAQNEQITNASSDSSSANLQEESDTIIPPDTPAATESEQNTADKEDPERNENAQNSGNGASVNLNQMENIQTTIGIDVSRYQGKIDWKKVSQSGIEFAIIRVGYRTTISGEITEDPYAKYNIVNALSNGIPIGVYFFSSAITEAEAKEEANWTADFISSYDITYPIAYNCENYNNSSNRQYSLSKEERSALACTFLDTIKAKGYQPMFYASKHEMEYDKEWNISEISEHGKVWVAWYPSIAYPDTENASYDGIHHMWQYTCNGSVDGILGSVDINVSYLNISSAEKPSFNTQNTETITISPEANMNFKDVNDTVTAKIEVNLRNKPSQDTDSTVITSIKNGTAISRTGISDSGWSRVVYNGQVCYAVSSYLTTDLTPATQASEAPSANIQTPDDTTETTTMKNQFVEVNEQVTPKEEVNLRSLPSVTDSEIIATVKNGEVLTKTGVSDLGWARVIYNGQILYCIHSYLTNISP